VDARQIDPQRLIQAENGLYYENLVRQQKLQLAASIHKTNKSIVHMTNHMEGRLSQIRGNLLPPFTSDLLSANIINAGRKTSIEVDIPKIKNLSSNSKPQMIQINNSHVAMDEHNTSTIVNF